MAVSFTNNFKNILDKLRNILRTEFKGALPIYIGHESEQASSQFVRLDPIGSDLSEYTIGGEMREFTINIYYYEEYQVAPAVRVLTKAVGKKLGKDKGNSMYLYMLFPYGPGKQACKFAGLPKPTGCV